MRWVPEDSSSYLNRHPTGSSRILWTRNTRFTEGAKPWADDPDSSRRMSEIPVSPRRSIVRNLSLSTLSALSITAGSPDIPKHRPVRNHSNGS